VCVDRERVGVEVKQSPHIANKTGGKIVPTECGEHTVRALQFDPKFSNGAVVAPNHSVVPVAIAGFDPRDRMTGKIAHEARPIERGRCRETSQRHPITLACAAIADTLE
jgi:hypothetical protein